MKATRLFMSPHQGFTLLELVLVILIVSVLAITATPRWTGSSQTMQYEARRVLDDIRYTQAMSLASGERYRWVRTSSNTYQILNQAGTATLFANGSNTVTLASGTTFGTFTNLPNGMIAFDSQGVPYTTSSLPGTALGSAAIIQLTTGSGTQTITIAPTTGFGSSP